MQIRLWTDGSSSLRTKRCAWAVVGTAYGLPVRLSGGMVGSNQLAELEAVRQAMLLVPEGDSATITSDSLYSIMGHTDWRRGWERNGWLNSAGQPVSHADLWRDCHRIYDLRKIEFVHVRGHQGILENELADALAGLQRAVDEGRADPSELDAYLRAV